MGRRRHLRSTTHRLRNRLRATAGATGAGAAATAHARDQHQRRRPTGMGSQRSSICRPSPSVCAATARGTALRRRARSSRTRSRRPTRSPTPRSRPTTAEAARRARRSPLPDLLLSLLLEEHGQGDLAEVARRIHDKLVRTPPARLRRLGRARIAGCREAAVGDAEGRAGEAAGVFHDVPETLPALLHAQKVQRRAATVGFEYESVADALTDLDDELASCARSCKESDPTPETEPDPRARAELGDVLFACVNVSRRLNVDPELALRQATRRFVARIERAEALAAGDGAGLGELPISKARTAISTERRRRRGG